jgi:hypothetical protein
MRKVLLFLVIMTGFAIEVCAQSITVKDTDGVPVAYATATTEQGTLIGVTDVNGLLQDTKGNNVLCFSHVAYKPITVNVTDLTNGVVTMEEISYTLPDVAVRPKELLYMQTYYRLTYIDDEGPLYYRAGVIDNTYEFANQKIKTKSKSISKAYTGLLKFLINTIAGRMIENKCKIQKVSTYALVTSNKGKWAKLNVTTDSTGRKVIRDSVSLLGYIDEDKKDGTRTTTFDHWLFKKHQDIAKEKNEKKKQKKEAELAKRQEEEESNYFEVYRMNDEGYSSIGDFVMMQQLSKGTFDRSGKEYILILESYVTETAYIDKKEFNQTRKENDVDKSYEDLLRYEKAHNIPPLPPHLKVQIDKLFEKDK